MVNKATDSIHTVWEEGQNSIKSAVGAAIPVCLLTGYVLEDNLFLE
jgi:hypothetical protein